ncbi:MAG TPA: hypothetical protein VK151_15375 [Fluviicola sp.]|nr:hypothetical protein [Fluviicola sp.]
MKEDNNIEDLFRSSFDHFEVAPPSSVKGAIDRELGAVTGKRGWWIFGSLSLIIAASLVFFFYTSSAKQAAGSSNGQLASNQTTDNSSVSTATGHSAANSSVDQTSSSSSNQEGRDNTTSQGTAGTKNQGHSDGNQAGSSTKANNTKQSKARRTPSMTSSRSSKKNDAAKTVTSKQKGTSDKKSSGKKSSGKQPRKNAGTPGFSDLTPPLQLTMFDPDPSKTLNTVDNMPVQGDGKTTAPDPKGNENPETDPKKEPVAEKADSTKVEETKKVMPQPKKSGDKWLASVYAGPSFSNSVKGDEYRSLSEKPGFQFSGEINRSFVAGYGVTTGASFSKRQETFKYTALQILDSAYMVTDSIPIYGNPNVPDSITGYYDTTYYVDDTISTDLTQLNRIQTFGIPLYFTKHFSFSDKWGLLVNAGAVFQFYNVSQGELNGMPAPTINDFGVNVSGRFHATYSWNNWMFSAGVNTGFELKQAVIYEGLDRKRYFISPQLGIHFRF